VALMDVLTAIVSSGAIFLLLAYLVRTFALRPQEARLKALATARNIAVEPSGGGVALLRKGPSSAPISRLLSTSVYAERWQLELDRADVKLRPSEYLLLRLAFAGLTILIVTVVGRSAIAFIVSLPLGAMAYMAPSYWIRIKTQRRVSAINKQLVETITLIANSLRAGFAFSQGLDLAAKRVGPPMSTELGRVLLDVNLGMATEEALQSMNERINSDDVDMVVTAILIQRNSGGNLAEVLEQVTETMRDRERIRGEIKTLTSAQRFTGWVLSAWPVLLFLAFWAINPSMMSLMWTTGPGIVLLFLWAALNLLGAVTLSKILQIDI
jgi:tight adherence protein B